MRYLLIGVVLLYKLIPVRVRRVACSLVGRTTPTADLALAGLRDGNISAFWASIVYWENEWD